MFVDNFTPFKVIQITPSIFYINAPKKGYTHLTAKYPKKKKIVKKCTI